ncbi:squalene cyclase [Tessaracoccus rhinocerotis]|uniref:Squalene cyclase n=1 Tax=Tessaracoccus rhinocerotis TaxID=1689449 RepID=A0A553K4J3_9ACTN|nr:squalene cyclase [Tessaracoccus rhinocerotis]TRY19630.1 squalene cyclase [Tessaracoccus rhinocerotis]
MDDEEVVEWLLDSDPALRWQVERDLSGAPEETWRATRSRVATQGHGAELLARQDPDGQWAGGAYFPADVTEADFADDGQPWTATTWSLFSLRDWGVEPEALGDTAERLARNSRWEYENLPYWDGEVDVCINALTLANGAWLGVDVTRIASWFPEHQLDDGGWNCEWVQGSRRSSFHSTLNALKGLLDHERITGGSDELRAARRRGEEYLLERGLMHRLSDGEAVGPFVARFTHPPRHVYSALNAADYFRDASLLAGSAPDPRLAGAVDLIASRRRPDGTWARDYVLPGRVWFDVDGPAGEPSKWVTLSALRVLRWWESAL